ncbi:hypothetical protein EV424DRAFT_1540056 [Suillus variegatus]|nr:hypothetical protein EV424DRAFT_1540056 [Suillus variegatus]
MLLDRTTQSFTAVPESTLIRQISHIAQLLNNIRTTAYVSSEQATALRGETPSIAQTSQDSEAEAAKLMLGKLGRSIEY